MTNYLERFLLSGKVAFVVGGCGLIGCEVVKALLNAGSKVIILDVNKGKGKSFQKELSRQGKEVFFENFDVTKLSHLTKILLKLVDKYGVPDVWVNLSYPRTKDWGRKLEDLKLESLRKNIDWQLNSCLWLTREVALLMREKKVKGSIINFGSIYGVQANDFTVYENTDLTSPFAYSAIKSGVINASRYLASYFGKDGIRVNTISPGGIFDNQNEKFVKNYEQKVPLKRMAHSEEMMGSVLFLASEASSYVTGHNLIVDGGWTIV